MKKKILGIFIVLILVLSITGCNKNVNESKEENNNQIYSINDENIFFITINGTKIKACEKISKLSNVNLALKNSYLNEEIPKNRYLMVKSIINTNGNEVFGIRPLNVTNSTITAKDAVIGAFEVGTYDYNNISSDTLNLNIEVVGGLKLGSSLDDIIKVLGTSYTEIKSNGLYSIPPYTKIIFSSGYKGYQFIIDESGKISQISWNNYDCE